MQPQMTEAEETAVREARAKNRMLTTLEVLGRLKAERPDVWELAEVVGVWVWVEFDAKPADDVRTYLLDLGFHWNHTRKAWQHCCGKPSIHTRGNPRFTYGTVPAKELGEVAI